MMSPQLTRKFAEMIDDYNDKIRNEKPRFWNEEIHKRMCTAMFRSVLTRYLYEYDARDVNEFREHLIHQALDSVPG
jgi:hypothetical protein